MSRQTGSEIKSFWCSENGREFIRANFWSKEGHSSKTFNTVGEAQFWLKKKRGFKHMLNLQLALQIFHISVIAGFGFAVGKMVYVKLTAI